MPTSSSSPQRRREYGSPSRQRGGGLPTGMYGGYLGHHHPSEYSGGPPPQGFGGPQGFPHRGQFGPGQYPFYGGGFGGPSSGAYFPHHPSDMHSHGLGGGPYQQSVSPERRSYRSSTSPPDDKRKSLEYGKKESISPPSREDKSKTNAKSNGYDKKAKSPSDVEGNHSYSKDCDDEDDDLVSNVHPMKSDFYFFASENKDEQMAKVKEEQVKDDNSAFHSLSALNERILKKWEHASQKDRTWYKSKEETDRYRFMSEDEIASRHCATLTSRTLHRNPIEDDNNIKFTESSDYESSPEKKIKYDNQEKSVKIDEEKEKDMEDDKQTIDKTITEQEPKPKSQEDKTRDELEQHPEPKSQEDKSSNETEQEPETKSQEGKTSNETEQEPEIKSQDDKSSTDIEEKN